MPHVTRGYPGPSHLPELEQRPAGDEETLFTSRGSERHYSIRPQQSMKENHSRSIAKAVSWRITGTIDTIIVSYVVTGKIALALSIGFVEVFTKIGLYYFHERIWNRISYGRQKKEDYEI